MRWAGLLAAAVVALGSGTSRAADNATMICGCIETAAQAYRVPPAILVILLNVEGGSLDAVSPNTNGTVDIGPMQINEIWLPDIAMHWGTTQRVAFFTLRDSFCANVEAGTWILRQGLDEAKGDFWEGVAYYHSHDPIQKRTYLRAVLEQVLRLQAQRTAAAGGGVAGSKG